MNPVASLTLRELIRSRPAGIGILEEMAGGTFWDRMDLTLSEFCRESDLSAEAVQHRIAGLPENPTHQDWPRLPLYSLIDFLTAGHRGFRARDLPEIHRLLETLRLDFPAGQASLETLLGEFTAFRQEFSWHMEEEEEFLFPKILRTEASVRHPELYPEVFKGSIGMFSSSQLQEPEHRFHQIVTDLSERLRGLVSDALHLATAKSALSAMQGYEARLKAHVYMECEILFPRALAMEASLLQRNA
jgi:regulator of cell morphogenesis and NO signaling